MVDVISYLLDMMQVKGTAYVGKNFSEPWGMYVEEHSEFARFHLVLAGQIWIKLPETGKQELLGKGDFVIIPNGRAHTLSDKNEPGGLSCEQIPNVDVAPSFQVFDNASGATHVLCGYFRISDNTPRALLSRLPEMFVERGDAGSRDAKIVTIARLIELELARQTASSPIVLNRLTEILCVYAIHRWLKHALTQDLDISALANPSLLLVLDAIHAHPAKTWTVENLADIYGQSRTAFAVQFKAVMGFAPMAYVKNWRFKLAQKMLKESSLSLDDIAIRSGYADTNAFNRAFKRETGTPPAAFRRLSRQ